MPSTASSLDPESDLPPPGSRWGTGAHSVLPYLARSLQARPAATAAEARDARLHQSMPGPSRRPRSGE